LSKDPIIERNKARAAAGRLDGDGELEANDRRRYPFPTIIESTKLEAAASTFPAKESFVIESSLSYDIVARSW